MRLEDGEIVLRPPSEEDIPAIAEACQDPEVPRWTRVPSPYTVEDARAFQARASEGAFAVVDRRTGEFLGMIGVRDIGDSVGQIGYWMKREARGRGVATRALRLVSEWAFDALKLARLQLITEPENVASQRVAEKAGFQREGLLRAFAEIKGRRPDFYLYSLLPGDL
ncbi:MAG: GNAT family N-acetyltransferase [Gaiellaceae bacterium]